MTEKKSSAQRVNKHRQDLRDKGKKPLSVMVSELTHKRISEYATTNKLNQGEALECLLSQPASAITNEK